MAEQKLYIGSLGPFLYEDTDSVSDPDGDFPGQTMEAMTISGQMHIGSAPSSGSHIARLGDVASAVNPLKVQVFS